MGKLGGGGESLIFKLLRILRSVYRASVDTVSVEEIWLIHTRLDSVVSQISVVITTVALSDASLCLQKI